MKNKYDYSSGGWYYVTICVQDRELIFENDKNNPKNFNL